MLSQLLSGHFDLASILAQVLAVLVIIFLVLPFHEWAHAQTAYLLGDKGIKERGRLSLNPLSHIDPIGALMMILVGFGWAKPVPVDARYFKNPRVGMGITALMGPVANLFAAMVGMLAFQIVWAASPGFFTQTPSAKSPGLSSVTRLPALNERLMQSESSGSTPYTFTDGLTLFM